MRGRENAEIPASLPSIEGTVLSVRTGDPVVPLEPHCAGSELGVLQLQIPVNIHGLHGFGSYRDTKTQPKRAAVMLESRAGSCPAYLIGADKRQCPKLRPKAEPPKP